MRGLDIEQHLSVQLVGNSSPNLNIEAVILALALDFEPSGHRMSAIFFRLGRICSSLHFGLNHGAADIPAWSFHPDSAVANWIRCCHQSDAH